ncbi:MAG: rRNA maturation RNase YbeY [Clostridiales bacterium]|jgi:probable rRNA maturation factor|nr:rRNA maturation RNase YbeY [Clostridiales bacterium]
MNNNILINNTTDLNLENYYVTIKSAAEKTFETIGPTKPEGGEVSFTLVTLDEIQEMNRSYRGLDKPTDVLSFPAEGAVIGDVIICFDQAVIQAREYGNTVKRELAFLAIHGLLHLLGYDHHNEADERDMRDMQKRIIAKLF